MDLSTNSLAFSSLEDAYKSVSISGKSYEQAKQKRQGRNFFENKFAGLMVPNTEGGHDKEQVPVVSKKVSASNTNSYIEDIVHLKGELQTLLNNIEFQDPDMVPVVLRDILGERYSKRYVELKSDLSTVFFHAQGLFDVILNNMFELLVFVLIFVVIFKP